MNDYNVHDALYQNFEIHGTFISGWDQYGFINSENKFNI